MTDTQVAPARVTITETDLLEAGIVALESGEYTKGCGSLRFAARWDEREGVVRPQFMHCAEGVLTELLVHAYPDRFAWVSNGLLLDRDSGEMSSYLQPEHWNLMHPRGAVISRIAAGKLRPHGPTIHQVNDAGDRYGGEVSFTEIAAALRAARAEIESA